MSSSSWRSIGGTTNYQNLNSINANHISTDTFTMRKSYVGLFSIDGILKVYDNAYFYKYIFFYNDLYIYGNIHLYNRAYLGPNDESYFYGTEIGVGLNTTTPSAYLDVVGSKKNVFIAQANIPLVENFVALNSANTAVSVGGNSYASIVSFYNSGQTSIPNTTLTSMHGNLHIEPEKSIIFRGRVVIGNKLPIDQQQHLDNENLTVYDTPTNIFHYDLYGNLLAYTGTTFSGITSSDHSTTFITLTEKNRQGVGFGGGIDPNRNLSFGAIGTYDQSGQFIISQSMVSEPVLKRIIKKSVVGYNTTAPDYESHILDINGPTLFRMGEINNLYISQFEFKHITFCNSAPSYGIAIGSPIEDYSVSTTIGRFKQYIVYTKDGGLTWTKSRVKNTNLEDDLEDGIFYFYSAYFQSPNFAVIAGDNNYMYYSIDYGASWNKYAYYNDYINFSIEPSIQTITTTSLTVKNNILFGGYKNNEFGDESKRGFYAYIPDICGGTIEGIYNARYKINPLGDNTDLFFVQSYIPSIDKASATNFNGLTTSKVYFLANSDISGSYLFTMDFDYNSNNWIEPFSYTHYPGIKYNYYYNDIYGEFLVGDAILYKDRGHKWVYSLYSPSAEGVFITHIDFIDSKNAVAVGTNGTFIYTKNGGETWDNVPDLMLNAYGNAIVIKSANLLNIKVLNKETFLITYVYKSYEFLTQNGESKIYHCYLPTLFNREETFLIDICGSMCVDGDIQVINGGDVYVDGSEYVNGEVVSYTGIRVTGDATNRDYYAVIGSINNPNTQISQGTVGIQGQNGMNNYNTWKFKVGATEQATSSYDTTRLRIVDDTRNSVERMTIDTYGRVGIATSTPISTLDISGITTVSDTTDSYDLDTGCFEIYGGGSIRKNLYIGGNLVLLSTNETYSTDTGALQVRGGVGIRKALFIGGNITISKTEVSTSPYTGALKVYGGVGVKQSVFVGGNITIVGNAVSTNTGTGALIVSGGVGINQSAYVGGNITIVGSDVTTNTGTGALIVSGGVGVKQSVFVGGNITIVGSAVSTSPSTGALIVYGGVGVKGDVYIDKTENVGGVITSNTGIEVRNNVTNTDYYVVSGSIDNPSIQTSQGTIGIQGQNGANNYNTWKLQVGAIEPGTSSYDTTRLRIVDSTKSGVERMTIDTYGYVGIATSTPISTLDVSGITTVSDTTYASNVNNAAFVVYGGSSITKNAIIGGNVLIKETTTPIPSIPTHAAFMVDGGASVKKSLFVGGNITITGNTVSTSTGTGALIVNGGVGINQSAYIGGNITIVGKAVSTNTGTGALIVSGGVGINQSAYVGGNITIVGNAVSTNTGTGALIVSGGVGVKQSVFVGGNITIVGSAVSTSPSTGALIVNGGVGIKGDVYIDKTENVGGVITSNTGIEVRDSDSNIDYYVIAGSIDDPMRLVSQGTIGVQGQNGTNNYNTWKFQVGAIESGTSSYDTTRLRIVDSTQSGAERMTIDQYGYVGIATSTPISTLDVNGITTISCTNDATSTDNASLVVYGGAGIKKSMFVGGNITITCNEDSTSTSSGALIVNGGVGIKQSAFVGGNITIVGNAVSTSTGTGALIISGGVGIKKSVYVGGNITITNNTTTTNTGSGALIVNGGVGINQSVFVGGNITITGNTVSTSPSTGALIVNGGVGVKQSVYVGGNITIVNNTPSTSSTTGALLVSGGVGVKGNLFVNDNIVAEHITGKNISVTGTYTGSDYNVSIGSISNPTSQISQGTLQIQGQNGLENYNTWNISVGALEPGTSSYNTSRLRVIDNTKGVERMTIDTYGYVGIGTNTPISLLDVNGPATISCWDDAFSDDTGAFVVRGGAGFSKNVYIGGNLNTSNLAVSGSCSFSQDITLNGVLSIYNTSNNALYLTGGANISGEIYTSGNITISDNTNAINTKTGSLIVNGGVGIAKDLYVGGNTITDKLFVNSVSYFYNNVSINGNIYITGGRASTSSTTGTLIVSGGIGIQGNIYSNNQIYSSGKIISEKAIDVTSIGENKEYTVSIGSISSPGSNYSQGTLTLQGQNGLENYSRWCISVGSYQSGTSSYENDRMRIIDSINSSERMTIDQNGYVGIGSTTPQTLLYVGGDSTFTGNVIASAYYTTSDYRIKENVTTLSLDINTEKIRPVSYYNTITQKDEIGVIAHELEEIYPFMVNGEKDDKKYQTVNYNHIIIALMNDIKILRAELRELSARL